MVIIKASYVEVFIGVTHKFVKPNQWRIILAVTADSYELLCLYPKLLTYRYLYTLQVILYIQSVAPGDNSRGNSS